MCLTGHSSNDFHPERVPMFTAYDPPGFMTEFDRIPGQREQWSRAVSGWFDECIASEAPQLRGQECQYFNQLHHPPVGPTLDPDSSRG